MRHAAGKERNVCIYSSEARKPCGQNLADFIAPFPCDGPSEQSVTVPHDCPRTFKAYLERIDAAAQTAKDYSIAFHGPRDFSEDLDRLVAIYVCPRADRISCPRPVISRIPVDCWRANRRDLGDDVSVAR